MAIPTLPQDPFQATHWPGQVYATSPASAHAMLHPTRVLARYPAFAYLSSDIRTYPRLLMENYYPPGSSEVQALQGIDPDTAVGGAIVGIALLALVAGAAVRFGAGWYVGQAVAPHGSEDKWKWIGGAAGLLGGPVGLAATAGVGLLQQDG